MKNKTQRVAIVTGANRGLGKKSVVNWQSKAI